MEAHVAEEATKQSRLSFGTLALLYVLYSLQAGQIQASLHGMPGGGFRIVPPLFFLPGQMFAGHAGDEMLMDMLVLTLLPSLSQRNDVIPPCSQCIVRLQPIISGFNLSVRRHLVGQHEQQCQKPEASAARRRRMYAVPTQTTQAL